MATNTSTCTHEEYTYTFLDKAISPALFASSQALFFNSRIYKRYLNRLNVVHLSFPSTCFILYDFRKHILYVRKCRNWVAVVRRTVNKKEKKKKTRMQDAIRNYHLAAVFSSSFWRLSTALLLPLDIKFNFTSPKNKSAVVRSNGKRTSFSSQAETSYISFLPRVARSSRFRHSLHFSVVYHTYQ